jgi:hypothetical protein
MVVLLLKRLTLRSTDLDQLAVTLWGSEEGKSFEKVKN